MHTFFHTPQPILVHHPPYYQSIHSTPCNLLLCTHPHPLVPHPLLHSTPPPFYHPTPSGTTLEAAMRAIVIDLSTITACPSPLDELRYFLRIAYERRGPSPPPLCYCCPFSNLPLYSPPSLCYYSLPPPTCYYSSFPLCYYSPFPISFLVVLFANMSFFSLVITAINK